MKVSQESVSRAASGAVSGIDRMIGKIPEQTQMTIKGIFFLVMFISVIGGIVYGVTRGREAARIKSAPIIETTNEAFELDMKRENREGNFAAVLDAELINEMKKLDVDKVRFPSQTNLEPDVDAGIVEPDAYVKQKETPGVRAQDPLFEGDYGKNPEIRSEVRPVEKRKGASAGDRESVIDDERKDLPRLMEPESGYEAVERENPARLPEEGGATPGRLKTDLAPEGGEESTLAPERRKSDPAVRPLDKKRRSGGVDVRTPAPLVHEEGIIGD